MFISNLNEILSGSDDRSLKTNYNDPSYDELFEMLTQDIRLSMRNRSVINPGTNARITENDIKLIISVLMRHKPIDPNDPFQRKNLDKITEFEFIKGTNDIAISNNNWPKVKHSALVVGKVNRLRSILDQYRILSNELLKEYAEKQAEKEHVRKKEDLNKYVIIDLNNVRSDDLLEKSLFPNKKFADANANFDYFHKQGWELLIPPYTEFVVSDEGCVYTFVKVTHIDHDTQTLRLEIEDYIDGHNIWIRHSTCELELIFNGVKCDINVINFIDFEQTLQSHINDMNWSNQEKTFWCDVFDIPRSRKEISIALWQGEEANLPPMMIHRKTELNAFKRLYGDQITFITNSKDVNNWIGKGLTRCILPWYVKTICITNIYLKNFPKQILKDQNGNSFTQVNTIKIYNSEEKI